MVASDWISLSLSLSLSNARAERERELRKKNIVISVATETVWPRVGSTHFADQNNHVGLHIERDCKVKKESHESPQRTQHQT